MHQFYEAYRNNEIVSALLRQLPWTHKLIILNLSQRPEEREFYLSLAIQEKWSSRALERQFKTALVERMVLSPAKLSAVLTQLQPDALSVFKDSYLAEFLDLPQGHAERDLHQGLLQQLKQFLTELGRDFALDRDVKKPHEQAANADEHMALCDHLRPLRFGTMPATSTGSST
jgi:predicted nuclease of restriction endonuclease-like (RecB) superfamily